MKIYKKDCIGRVPSSIRELEECALYEQICMSLCGAVPIQRSSSTEGKENEERSLRRR